MKTLLRQLQDLHHQLHYSVRSNASIDKALKQVYAILVQLAREIATLDYRTGTLSCPVTSNVQNIPEEELNDNQQKSVDPYNPGAGTVCGSETLSSPAIKFPIGEDHED